MVPSVNTVVFTPDWKSNDTALGSGEAGAGRRLLRPLGAGRASDGEGGAVLGAKVRAWAGSASCGVRSRSSRASGTAARDRAAGGPGWAIITGKTGSVWLR